MRPKKTHPRPEPFGLEFTAEGLGSKARSKSKPVSLFSKGGKRDFLELVIWILFVICYLVLVISSIQRHRNFLICCSAFLLYLGDTTPVSSLKPHRLQQRSSRR